MASVEFIQKRINGAEKKIEKLNAKLRRIEIAKASNYEDNNPYCYSDYDLRVTKHELEEATANLKKYEAQLAKEEEKAASRNVQVINDFLDQWEQDCIAYFNSEYEKYQKALKEYRRKDKEYCEKLNHSFDLTAKDRKDLRNAHTELARKFHKEWAHVTQFEHGALSWHETMVKDLGLEKIRKYDDIIERTNDIVGKITDASALRISPKGNLDGFVFGEEGQARIQTIGAGGYNIQCFHFRTLVKPV